jgi:putative YhdH/YhfP family quinone oxidoreductase
MTEHFKAVVADKIADKLSVEIRELTLADLPDEDVLVDVAFSTLNYKDGLAVTGKAPICRRLPMVCGIDLAGTVVSSRSPDWKAGDKVLVNGYGLSESYWGGYSQRQKLKPEWLVRVPSGFSLEEVMAIGTAGYTAMLCVMALEDEGITPGQGDILVSGAAGGVGSVAVSLLASLGYRVVASSGRPELGDYLKSLGAAEVISRSELAEKGKPLGAERWAGAIDSVGGQTLATLLSQTKYGGAVAACGLAGGTDLPTTVMPFILRGVKLIGVDSVMAPKIRRLAAWARLEKIIDRKKLHEMMEIHPMSEIFELAPAILAGKIRGRMVIDVNR